MLTIHVRGLDPDGVRVGALVDNGFGDALITQERHNDHGTIELDDVTIVDVDPQVLIRRIEAVDGVRVVGFGQPYVNTVEIARRIGQTPQSVSLYVSGRRGPGGFPTPMNPGSSTQVWAWPPVARWLRTIGVSVDEADIVDAQRCIELNAQLEPEQTTLN